VTRRCAVHELMVVGRREWRQRPVELKGGGLQAREDEMRMGLHAGKSASWILSHLVLTSKLNAFLYVCEDQVSHIK
jgi:hypothetical protein